VFTCNNRHEQKLHHVQKHPHGHKRANRHIPAVPKLELVRALAFHVEEALSPPAWQPFYTGSEQPADEEVEERCDEDREEQEVQEDEDEGYA
jgi:hypothetical protein